jgi:hypothetical protein
MKRISTQAGTRRTANSSNLLSYVGITRSFCGLLGILAAAVGIPQAALGGELGPTSSASSDISVVILPRVKQLKADPAADGNSLLMHANFDGYIERYSGNLAVKGDLAPQGRPVNLHFGQQKIAAKRGEVLMFMPR